MRFQDSGERGRGYDSGEDIAGGIYTSSKWPEFLNDKLYVVTPIFNPSGYASRYKLYWDFANYLAQFPNVEHHTVELVKPGQKFMVTQHNNPRNVQLVGEDSLWLKENMINIGIRGLPECAKY